MIVQKRSRLDGNSFNNWSYQQKKKKRALLLSRLFVVLIFWAIVVFYLVSPFSKARILEINGHYNVIDEEEIYNIGDFNENTFWWSVDINEVNKKLEGYAEGKYVLDFEASYSFLGLNVYIEENIIVGKALNSDNSTTYYLKDGTIFYSTTDDYYDQKHLRNTTHIPSLDLTMIDDFNKFVLLDNLGDLSVIKYLDSVKKYDESSSDNNIFNIELTFSKESISKEKDLVLIVDVDKISRVLSQENFDKILNELYGNDVYLNSDSYVAIYGPTKGDNDSYGFLPIGN